MGIAAAGAQLEASEAKTQQAAQQAENEHLARVASETNRQLERQYCEQVSEIETRAQADLAQSRLAGDRARDAGQRLQRELAGYASSVSVAAPQRPPLPASARQTQPPPSICLPSCSDALMKERESWRQLLMRPG